MVRWEGLGRRARGEAPLQGPCGVAALAQGAAQVVERLAEVGPGGGLGVVGPEKSGELLATMGAAGLHGQIGEQGAGLVRPEPNHGDPVELHRKTAEQRKVEASHLGHPRALSSRRAQASAGTRLTRVASVNSPLSFCLDFRGILYNDDLRDSRRPSWLGLSGDLGKPSRRLE